MEPAMADTQLIARQLLSDLKRDFGLTDEQAAGVVGNLMHESGGFNSLQEVNPTVPGSAGGFGFAQWTGPRRKSFDSYVEKQGLDRNSYDANYGFLKHELENNRYERNQFNKVKKAGTAAEAARIVSENYLRPGIPHNASRVRYAEQVLPFAKMPVPPGELPTVGTLQDTRQPVVPPLPTTAAPNLAALRANTSPTGGNSDLQTALDRVATRERNRVTPASADERITARNRAWAPPAANLTTPGGIDAVFGGLQQDSGLAAALAARTAPQTRPALPMSYAGQERAPRPSVFNGDPGTRANGPVVAQIPTVAPRQAPVPASPFDRVSARLNALPSIERLPEIARPAIGGPPTTRTVQSVPMPPARVQVSASDMARGRSVAPQRVAQPSTSQILNGTGFRGGGPVNAPERLAASPLAPPAIYGGNIAGVGTRAIAPMPFARPDFMPQVASALDVVPMPPLPIPRPGIGGPYRAAPIPAPRTQRPGLFRLGGFELPQLPTQARTVAGRTAMFDAPVRQVFNSGGGQNTAAVQSYRDQGYSPSQAYDAANRAATERAISNARDPAAAARLNSR
jgi:hypothetical protein